MKRSLLCVCLWALCTVSWSQTASRRPLELPPEFTAIRDKIAPTAEEELWRQIPWKTSLLEARQIAARDGKPIFVWSMDGHPLCLG